MVFSSDGRRIISACLGGEVQLWDTETAERIRTLLKLPGGVGVRGVVFDRPGSRIVVTSHDKLARLVDVDSGETLQEFVGHQCYVASAALSPGEKYLVTGRVANRRFPSS